VNKHYLLPVVAVVETMKDLPDVVMLQAHLSSLPGVSKDACLAQIILGQGQVYSCKIIATRTGIVLREQQEAYHALERCGDVNWSVRPEPSLHAPVRPQTTSPPTATDRMFPRQIPSLRVSRLSPEILEPLSHPYRRVLRLVDGGRSIEDIARLLNKEPQEIQQMLAALPHLIQF
jgi:hypothetical protein